jgi:hypothetical protein
MNIEAKTCFDCLHCKVSAKSTANVRLCFCSETKSKKLRIEAYWLDKKLCTKFNDMSVEKRRLLIKYPA